MSLAARKSGGFPFSQPTTCNRLVVQSWVMMIWCKWIKWNIFEVKMHIKTNQDSKLRYPQWWQVAWICVFVYVFFSIFSNGMFTSPLKVFSDGAWALFLTIKELLSSKWTRGESKHLVFWGFFGWYTTWKGSMASHPVGQRQVKVCSI